ncbi:glycoside hydrolase family 115 protein, partial [Colletotrichum scovillei]
MNLLNKSTLRLDHIPYHSSRVIRLHLSVILAAHAKGEVRLA